jgi:hypothetical protein
MIMIQYVQRVTVSIAVVLNMILMTGFTPRASAVTFTPSDPFTVVFPDTQIGTTSSIVGFGASWTAPQAELDLVSSVSVFPPFPSITEGDFSITNTSVSCVTPGLTCTWDLSFTPSAPGTQTTLEFPFITVNFGAETGSVSLLVTLQGAGIDASNVVVALPAALPLFGTGLALIGFIGWRRRHPPAA